MYDLLIADLPCWLRFFIDLTSIDVKIFVWFFLFDFNCILKLLKNELLSKILSQEWNYHGLIAHNEPSKTHHQSKSGKWGIPRKVVFNKNQKTLKKGVNQKTSKFELTWNYSKIMYFLDLFLWKNIKNNFQIFFESQILKKLTFFAIWETKKQKVLTFLNENKLILIFYFFLSYYLSNDIYLVEIGKLLITLWAF